MSATLGKHEYPVSCLRGSDALFSLNKQSFLYLDQIKREQWLNIGIFPSGSPSFLGIDAYGLQHYLLLKQRTKYKHTQHMHTHTVTVITLLAHTYSRTAVTLMSKIMKSWYKQLHRVSKKKLPTCYNFDAHEWILILFGRNVTDKVGNQKTLYYATSNNLCFCTTCQTGKHENHIFHSTGLCYTHNAPVRCLPERKIVICDVFYSV